MEEYCTYQYTYRYESEEERDALLERLDEVLSRAHDDLKVLTNNKITISCPD